MEVGETRRRGRGGAVGGVVTAGAFFIRTLVGGMGDGALTSWSSRGKLGAGLLRSMVWQ